MKLSRYSPFLFAGICIFLIISFNEKSRDSFDAYALAAHDGDTITVIFNRKTENVRLLGIDCPELEQKYGKNARDFTLKFLGLDHERRVSVKLEFDQEIRDIYGRLLAYVYNSSGQQLNENLVSSGYAVPYFVGVNRKFRDTFYMMKDQAEKNRKNIWNPDDPLDMKPAEYRRQHKVTGQ